MPSVCIALFELAQNQTLTGKMVPGAGFEPATSGQLGVYPVSCSPDYESGAQTRLGYPGSWFH